MHSGGWTAAKALNSLLPVYIDRQSIPEILAVEDRRFGEVRQYLESITAEAGLNGRLIDFGQRIDS